MARAPELALAVSLCAAVTISPPAFAGDTPASAEAFATCRQRFADKPHEYESALCFYQVAAQGLANEGLHLFEALTREHPENVWLPLANGHLFRETDPDRAEALYRRAAEGFRTRGDAAGEIVARSTLRGFLFLKARLQDATTEMDRVAALERAVDDPLLKAQIWTLQAMHVQETGADLGVAYRLLKQAQRAAFPAGPYRVKRDCLYALGLVAFRLGRVDEALATYTELEQLATHERDPRAQASARYNILNVYSMRETLLPTPGAKDRLLVLAQRSLESGLSARQAIVTLKSHGTIAGLLAYDPASRPQALAHVEECLALSVSTRQPHDEAVCSWLEASLLRHTDPGQARAAETRALDATARANTPVTHAYSAGRHMQLSWETSTRREAIRTSLAAIAAIETLRSLQEDTDSSAELFSTWTLDYYWFAGRLLRDVHDRDLDLAFSVTERLRARSLLDQLNRAGRRLDSSHPAVADRRTLLERIAGVQRRLMTPTLSTDSRRKALEQLEALEHREQEAQRQIALAATGRHREPPTFASLEQVQSALAENEALLSFQVGIWETYEGDFGGGSWLTAVTRHGRSVHRIPDRSQLAPMMPVFNGLLGRNDEVATAAAVRLYHDLVGEALARLPAGINRLILIPDGPLHRLPFDTLRAGPEAQPLAARYELASAPSATLWLRWRGAEWRPGSRSALSFADPEIGVDDRADAPERNAALQYGLRLGRLPHARRESGALQRHLGAVDSLVGPSASEKAVKERKLRDYSILHFAAHAVADESRPDRSAVLLSAGGNSEDGLLQAREIEQLDLEGRIVLLSACHTASGAVLSGEGVLSLARAFFAAGARTVIGTRWPIRDDDAAAIFESFSRALGRGATVSNALMHAKLDAIGAGRPAAAWASLVVLGDGTIRPLPKPRFDLSRADRLNAALAFGILVLVALRHAKRDQSSQSDSRRRIIGASDRH